MFSRAARPISRKITYDVTHSVHRDIDGFKNEIVRTLDQHVKNTERVLDAHMASTKTALDAHMASTERALLGQFAMIATLGATGSALAYVGYQELDHVKTDVADLKTDVAVLKVDVAELKVGMNEIKQLIIENNRRRWF